MRGPAESKLAIFGLSLISNAWSGASSYCRGVLKALARHGYDITVFEPDGFDRHAKRGTPDPGWATLVVHAASQEGATQALAQAAGADVIVKTSGVGPFDTLLEGELHGLRTATRRVVLWDIDAPSTLERVEADPTDPFRAALLRYDAILTHGGGERAVHHYRTLGAARCRSIYSAVDPELHHPVAPDPQWTSDLTFLGDRLAEDVPRVEEFFFSAARRMPERSFILGGEGWNPAAVPPNVRYVGPVEAECQNVANASARAVLNLHGCGTLGYGASAAMRLFEAAGAGACVISDACEGIGQFLEPSTEILLATGGAEVERHLSELTFQRANLIGQRARRRLLVRHTYDRRADEVDGFFRQLFATLRVHTPPRTGPPRADGRFRGRMGLRH